WTIPAGRGAARRVEIGAGGGNAGGRLMSETSVKTHTGSCHCGAVAYEVDVGLDGLVECNYSHCYRKGFVLAFAPRSAVRLTKGEGETTSYFFNQHKIEHRFCMTCGVQAFGYGVAPDGGVVAAIYIRTLTDVEPWDWAAQRVD